MNSILVATQPQTGSIGNGGIVRMSGYDTNAEIWDGKIANFQLYNRDLSAAEVFQNFEAQRGRYGL